MLFAWINLLILYFFLKKLLFKPVKKMIDDRQREVDDMYETAEKDRSDAEKMKAAHSLRRRKFSARQMQRLTVLWSVRRKKSSRRKSARLTR